MLYTLEAEMTIMFTKDEIENINYESELNYFFVKHEDGETGWLGLDFDTAFPGIVSNMFRDAYGFCDETAPTTSHEINEWFEAEYNHNPVVDFLHYRYTLHS
jgi:hypothetical protein